jgi:hypothetical protein
VEVAKFGDILDIDEDAGGAGPGGERSGGGLVEARDEENSDLRKLALGAHRDRVHARLSQQRSPARIAVAASGEAYGRELVAEDNGEQQTPPPGPPLAGPAEVRTATLKCKNEVGYKIIHKVPM